MIHLLFSKIHQEMHEEIFATLDQFPEDFQAKVRSFWRWEDAQLSILGRLLLLEGLDRYYSIKDPEIVYSDFNKPLLKGVPLNFNISHSGDLTACVISEYNVGVDLEQIVDIDVSLFQNQMTSIEWIELQGSEKILVSFYDLWTKKEAILKGDGRGLSVPMNSFYILDDKAKLSGKLWGVTPIDLNKPLYSCHIACDKVINESDIVIKYFPGFQLINVQLAANGK